MLSLFLIKYLRFFKLIVKNPLYKPLANTKMNINTIFFVGPLDEIPDLKSINITSGNNSLAQFSMYVPKNVLSISLTVSVKNKFS